MRMTRTRLRVCALVLALGYSPVICAQKTSQSTASQSALAGTGTTNFIPIWTNSTTLGNSITFQTGGQVAIGNTVPGAKLEVTGNAFVRGDGHSDWGLIPRGRRRFLKCGSDRNG